MCMKIHTSIESVNINKMLILLRTLGCSNCGWDKTACDAHHIKPRSRGGSDSYSNLTYLCPNCHRLAHNEKLSTFTTIAEQVKDKWEEFLSERREEILAKYRVAAKECNNISKHNSIRKALRDENSVEIVKNLREANIDFSRYGWAKMAAPIVGIAPQKVRAWINRYAPDLVADAFIRK